MLSCGALGGSGGIATLAANGSCTVYDRDPQRDHENEGTRMLDGRRKRERDIRQRATAVKQSRSRCPCNWTRREDDDAPFKKLPDCRGSLLFQPLIQTFNRCCARTSASGMSPLLNVSDRCPRNVDSFGLFPATG